MDMQIIIVTRDSQFRVALKRVCSGQGCRIETTDDVAVALEIAARRPVSVMVADATVHDIGDGLGLAQAIRDQNPDAKCFLIVDNGLSDGSSFGENEPWLRLVRKPIQMLQFSADVVETIARSKEAS